MSDKVVAENKPANIGPTESVLRRALGTFSGKSEHWWIAVCTAMLTVSTVVLFIATFALVHSTDQLAKQEKEHGEEEWRRVVHATVGELSNATNVSPARRVCARYVVAVDVANGVTAEDAGRVAHARAAPKAFGNFPLSRIEMATEVTNSLLEAVVGSTPIVESYNLVSLNAQLTPLAKACLTSLFSGENFASILAKEKGAIVSRLHQELVGYQNAVERAAELATANPPIPESARDALADNLEGAFDDDTRLFLEATSVFWFFGRPDVDAKVGSDLSDLKKFASEEFSVCREVLKFEKKEIGKCFKDTYRAVPFLSAPAEEKNKESPN